MEASSIFLSKSAMSHKKLKNPNSSSFFHKELIQQPLSHLDLLIQSKQKHLESFKSKQEELIPAQQLELDHKINNLNKRILSLKFKISEKFRNLKGNHWKRKLQSLQSKLSFVHKSNQQLLTQVEGLETEATIKKQEIQELERKSSEKLKSLNQETLDLTEELLRKDEELTETRKDLNDIQKILTGMNEIFFSVQQKMDEKRKEINELNLNYFELVARTEDFDVLEQGFREVFADASKSKLLKEKMKKKYGKVKEIYKNIHQLPQITEKIVQRLAELDQFIESILDEKEVENILNDCKNDLASVYKSLEISLAKPLKMLQQTDRQSSAQRLNHTSLEATLSSVSSSISLLDSQKTNSDLISLLNDLKTQEFIFKDSQNSLNKSLETLQNSLNEELSSLKSLMTSNLSRDSVCNSLSLQLTLAESQVSKTQQMKKADMNLAEELKTELTSLERKITRHKHNLEVHGTPGDSRKMRNIMNQVVVLHEEMMQKDSQLVKKYFESRKSLKECQKLEKSIKTLEINTEKVRENVLAKVHEEVETKDKEIEMLKEILRENASEIKSKEQKLAQMRKQIDSLVKSN